MKKKSEENTFFYRSTFDPLIARLYNNKKCNQCHGKGYLITDMPSEGFSSLRKNRPTKTTQTYCRCVEKNIKKQRQEEWKKYKSTK